MTSNKEGHHLIDQFLVCESARVESDGDDVFSCLPLLVYNITLSSDQISAGLFDEFLSFNDFRVAFAMTRQYTCTESTV